MKHKISTVEEGSIAGEMGITPGDFLLTINSNKVLDVFDYRFMLQVNSLIIEIEKPDGEVWEIDIAKDEDDDLGMAFDPPLMSDIKLCKNNCIFCFVDQEPPGLRKTLYVKDDDWRLSFLFGNFVTLTNVTWEEAFRIRDLHLSPLYISIHATDNPTRSKMMNLVCSDSLLSFLRLFGEAGIEMHFQIVLCKNINDGKVLFDTLSLLATIRGAKSVAIVPAGVTKHREGLYPLETFTSPDAIGLIHQIAIFRSSLAVYLSDEWFLLAKSPLPTFNKYNDFPQLSNGVGLVRLFEYDFLMALDELTGSVETAAIGIVTGTLATPFIRGLMSWFTNKFTDVRFSIFTILNVFYGETITVSGLLTGADIINQLEDKCSCDVLFLPGSAFRSGTDEMIDGKTLTELEQTLKIPVRVGSQDGGKFAKQLYEAVSKC